MHTNMKALPMDWDQVFNEKKWSTCIGKYSILHWGVPGMGRKDQAINGTSQGMAWIVLVYQWGCPMSEIGKIQDIIGMSQPPSSTVIKILDHAFQATDSLWPFKLLNPIGSWRQQKFKHFEGGNFGNQETNITTGRLIQQMNQFTLTHTGIICAVEYESDVITYTNPSCLHSMKT
ncbi:hypothetical protein EDC04DRAFT_2608981 [Pisolithus marmoratus]|nr:hypothetical protein EDC04DRAFT_2608981 [Pisolithus marmoratus]